MASENVPQWKENELKLIKLVIDDGMTPYAACKKFPGITNKRTLGRWVEKYEQQLPKGQSMHLIRN